VEIKDTYKTIEGSSEGLYKDKGSRFISYSFHITDEDQAKIIIQRIKKEHFSARHHCYAYRLGFSGEKYRVNDDGEPSGTAGKPIFGQLLSNDLTNILVVVVRYFGGTLLGVSGLINAYKCATVSVIENSKIVLKIIEDQFELVFDYPIQNIIMRIIKDEQLEVFYSEFDMNCKLHIRVRKNIVDDVLRKLELIVGLKMKKIE
jgi:uncharacterized YigZ family protein